MNRKIAGFTTFALLSAKLLLSACGAGGPETGTATATAEPTRTPAAALETPTPQETPHPTMTPCVCNDFASGCLGSESVPNSCVTPTPTRTPTPTQENALDAYDQIINLLQHIADDLKTPRLTFPLPGENSPVKEYSVYFPDDLKLSENDQLFFDKAIAFLAKNHQEMKRKLGFPYMTNLEHPWNMIIVNRPQTSLPFFPPDVKELTVRWQPTIDGNKQPKQLISLVNFYGSQGDDYTSAVDRRRSLAQAACLAFAR